MKTEFVVAISVLFGVAFLLYLLKLVLVSTPKRLGKHIQNRFSKEKMIGATTKAIFLGELSKGGKQILSYKKTLTLRSINPMAKRKLQHAIVPKLMM